MDTESSGEVQTGNMSLPWGLPLAEYARVVRGEAMLRYLEKVLGDANGNLVQAAKLARMEKGNFRRAVNKYMPNFRDRWPAAPVGRPRKASK